MKFWPVNRYIHIELQPEKSSKTESSVLLPDSYTEQLGKNQRHAKAKVIETAPDVRISRLAKGDFILIDRSMVEEIKLDEGNITLILDNYVIGIVT